MPGVCWRVWSTFLGEEAAWRAILGGRFVVRGLEGGDVL